MQIHRASLQHDDVLGSVELKLKGEAVWLDQCTVGVDFGKVRFFLIENDRNNSETGLTKGNTEVHLTKKSRA